MFVSETFSASFDFDRSFAAEGDFLAVFEVDEKMLDALRSIFGGTSLFVEWTLRGRGPVPERIAGL